MYIFFFAPENEFPEIIMLSLEGGEILSQQHLALNLS